MKTPITWNTDQYGRLLGPRLHDGSIYGLNFSDGDALSLHIRNASREPVVLGLIGIAEINIVQLCNGAIISEVYLWKVDCVPYAWDVPDGAWNTLFAERYGPAGAKERASKIIRKSPDSLLVQVDCSYGGAIAAICNQVELFNESAATA